jgi:Icc protein
MSYSGMAYVIAQVSDIHIGGPLGGSGDRFSAAVDAINAMTLAPDLVLLTGDLTDHGSAAEWDELQRRLQALRAPWTAIRGNHDRGIADLAGHRAIDAGPLRLVLLDSSAEDFAADDAAWLEAELARNADRRTVVAIHHPPFETGIWWMDCLGMRGAELFEAVVRRHHHVEQVVCGHVHRPIHTQWGGCSVWVCPSTYVTIAADLDPAHEPAHSAEGPSFSLHAYTGAGVISHVVPVGAPARRSIIGSDEPEFVAGLRAQQRRRGSHFTADG